MFAVGPAKGMDDYFCPMPPTAPQPLDVGDSTPVPMTRPHAWGEAMDPNLLVYPGTATPTFTQFAHG
jgi:hypothetical protein